VQQNAFIAFSNAAFVHNATAMAAAKTAIAFPFLVFYFGYSNCQICWLNTECGTWFACHCQGSCKKECHE